MSHPHHLHSYRYHCSHHSSFVYWISSAYHGFSCRFFFIYLTHEISFCFFFEISFDQSIHYPPHPSHSLSHNLASFLHHLKAIPFDDLNSFLHCLFVESLSQYCFLGNYLHHHILPQIGRSRHFIRLTIIFFVNCANLQMIENRFERQGFLVLLDLLILLFDYFTCVQISSLYLAAENLSFIDHFNLHCPPCNRDPYHGSSIGQYAHY